MQSPADRLARPGEWPPWGLRRSDGLRTIGFLGGGHCWAAGQHKKTGGRGWLPVFNFLDAAKVELHA